MKWLTIIAAVIAVGCSHSAGESTLDRAVGPGIQLTRVFDFDGNGPQPTFNNDPSKKIQWVATGRPNSGSQGQASKTFFEGRVGLADGTEINVENMVLSYSTDGVLQSVSGT